jgi:hypothetical protein
MQIVAITAAGEWVTFADGKMNLGIRISKEGSPSLRIENGTGILLLLFDHTNSHAK